MIKKIRNLLEIIPYLFRQGPSPLIKRLNLLLANNKRSRDALSSDKLGCAQYGQDLWIQKFLISKGIRRGRVLDIGANDGITFSNSYLLEKDGFDAVCIEPNPDIFRTLTKERACVCLNCGVGLESGHLTFLQVNADRQASMLSGFEKYMSKSHLTNLLHKEKAFGLEIKRFPVELVSVDSIVQKLELADLQCLLIDTEGGELPVVRRFLELGVQISLICIENNDCHYKIAYELATFGYQLEVILGGDEIYFKSSAL